MHENSIWKTILIYIEQAPSSCSACAALQHRKQEDGRGGRAREHMLEKGSTCSEAPGGLGEQEGGALHVPCFSSRSSSTGVARTLSELISSFLCFV
ncbi:hypothetical protein NL676_020119 [Syzygium grande]|nr:hypothetical protein NL676_020119 [Syzygium grande]